MQSSDEFKQSLYSGGLAISCRIDVGGGSMKALVSFSLGCLSLHLASCSSEPEITATNALIEEVAAKVAAQ